MRILLIEDDTMIADAIKSFFSPTEYRVDVVHNLEDAHIAIDDTGFEAIILDLNLPDGSGLDFLQKLRACNILMPIIVLTARGTLLDRLAGLDLGADDYLAKPFDLEELAARLRAVSRRSKGRAQQVLNYGELCIMPDDMTVRYGNEAIDVSVSQFRLLQYLVENCGRLRTKKQIIDALYSWDDGVAENTVEVYISQLRKILWPELIKTMRGVGYIVPKID